MAIKILFDHQKFSTQRYGGISRYFANLIQEAKQQIGFNYKLGVLTSHNHYIKHEKLILNRFEKLKSPPIASKINQLYCERLLKADDYDIFHPTYYDPYFLNLIKKPLVVTIHDMTYERLPEYFWAQDPLTLQKRLNIERADHIIAISETTKNDLIRYSNVNPAKVTVVYHGIKLDEPLISTAVPDLPSEYILFIGDRSGYKNFYLFINAFKELSLKYPDLQVILTGGGSMGIADQELLKRLKIEHKVKHVQVTDEQLNYLYQYALVFVYPSLHEGFGLPILEAFKAQCPVILSDTECFREIGADAALFFNMHNQDDLFVAIEKVITNPDTRNKLIEKGNQRIKDFPLAKSMEETFNLYKSLIK